MHCNPTAMNREGDEQPGKIDLPEEAGVVDESRAADVHVLREVIPRELAAQVEKRGRQAVRLDPRDDAEDDEIHRGVHHRLEEVPERAEQRLLVARDEVALDQQHEQIAVFPERVPVDAQPAAGRLDDDLVAGFGGYVFHDQHPSSKSPPSTASAAV